MMMLHGISKNQQILYGKTSMIPLQSMWILIARFVFRMAGWYIEILDSRLVAVAKLDVCGFL